jgi:hypothetical protein
MPDYVQDGTRRPSAPQLGAADDDPLGVRDLEIAFPPFRILWRGGPEAFLDQISVQRVDAANAEDHAWPPGED